jgi:hypothetical protein
LRLSQNSEAYEHLETILEPHILHRLRNLFMTLLPKTFENVLNLEKTRNLALMSY